MPSEVDIDTDFGPFVDFFFLDYMYGLNHNNSLNLLLHYLKPFTKITIIRA